ESGLEILRVDDGSPNLFLWRAPGKIVGVERRMATRLGMSVEERRERGKRRIPSRVGVAIVGVTEIREKPIEFALRCLVSRDGIAMPLLDYLGEILVVQMPFDGSEVRVDIAFKCLQVPLKRADGLGFILRRLGLRPISLRP